MTRVTVFGGNGFIGQAVAGVLRARGVHVFQQPRDDILPPAGGFGTLVWCIGLTANFRTQPLATATAHVGLLAEVLAQGAHDRVVYLSSTRVYEGAPATSEEADLVVNPIKPFHLYNATKIAGESLVLTSEPGDNVVVRMSNVVGPGEVARSTFVGAIARQALDGEIVLESAPETVKDYIWIDDAAQIFADIAIDGRQLIYNVARGKQTPHSDWVDAFSRATGCKISVQPGAIDESFLAIEVSRTTAEFRSAIWDPLARALDVLKRG